MFLHPSVLQFTKSSVDWWTVMRHYGVPTRLIDWTMSFYVTAYFAASESPGTDGAIFVLHLHTLDQAMITAHGIGGAFNKSSIVEIVNNAVANPAIHIVKRANALLDRMVAQQCCFMYSLNVATDIESTLIKDMPSHAPNGGIVMIKLRIPSVLKKEIMKRLRAMNLNAATLFPGLDGIGRSLDDIVRYP